MALANYDEYVTRLQENRAVNFLTTSTILSSPGLIFTPRLLLPQPAAVTTSVALDRTSSFSFDSMPVGGGGRLSVLGARLSGEGNQAIILVDLLNISSGMDATLTSPQSTNLPGGSTAALTRHTSGVGVMGGLVIEAAGGATATTFTVSYTNQDGTAGRVSTSNLFPASVSASRLILFPLAADDTGIRSVQSVTLAASTGLAGNFGVCLFKPLCMFALDNFQGVHTFDAVTTGGFIGALAEVQPDACLSAICIIGGRSTPSGAVVLGEV